ncbi:MAG: efflux RND transporter periplasmic adaptor subunit [Candidatus Halalkalibacterium sp. M3_1C_030]
MRHISFIVLLGSVLFLQACGGSSESQPFQRGQRGQQATSVETITVEREDISKQIRSFGNIKAQDIVQVTPQVTNRITQIYADLGDTVRQGDRLAKIYDVPFEDQYQQALASLEQSRATFQRDSLQFERQKKLYERDLISSTEFDNARATYQNSKAQLQSSRANLTQSRENLENTVIRSPVFGVVLNRSVAEGDLASTGQVAYEIANLTGYETRVYLPLEEWQAADVGQPVTFRLSNQRESSAQGRVSRISPRLDPTTGLGEVVITLTEKGSSIYQGVLVEAIINVETRKQAVVVPRSALVENVQTLIEPESNTIQLNRTYSVFVVQDDSIALKRDLQLGIEQGDRVEITTGLQAGDQIVVTGQNSLEDSSKVRVATGSPFRESPEVPIENTENLSSEERRDRRQQLQSVDDSTRQARRQQMQQRRQNASPDTGSTNTNN